MIVTQWQVQGQMLMVAPTDVGEKVGSIFIPEQSRYKSNSGTVVMQGPGVDGDYLGKEVFFGTHDEYRVVLDDADKEVFLINASAVLLVREPQAAPTLGTDFGSVVPPNAMSVVPAQTDDSGIPYNPQGDSSPMGQHGAAGMPDLKG
jgi:hypothetical protein